MIIDNADNNSSPIDLSTVSYIEILEKIDKLIYSKDPRAAFEYLKRLFAENNAVRDSCHGLAHYIGHGGFKKYQNFSTAVSSGDDFCGNGYTHGVIEEYFGSLDTLEGNFKDLCAYNDHSCIHGIGHGFMYYFENDLPKSLSYCDQLDTSTKRIYCSEGIFHENFETNTDAHIAKFLNPEDPFYPCFNYTDAYRSVCSYYSGRYVVRINNNDYVKAIKECDKSPSPVSCASGVGSITMRQNLDNPIVVQQACENASPNLRYSCVQGAVTYHEVNSRFNRSFKTQLCEPMTNQEIKNFCNSF